MVNTIKISDIKREGRHRKDFGDIKTLAENIRHIGLLQPISITEDNELICGDRRIEAYLYLGKTEIEAVVRDVDEIMSAEASENGHRKSWTASEAVAIGSKIEKRLSGRQGRNRQTKGTKLAGLDISGKTIDLVATMLGMGRENYRKAKKIVENGIPELIEAADKERISLNVAHEISKEPKEKQLEIWEASEISIIAEAKRIQKERAEKNRKGRIKKSSKKPKRKPRQASQCYSYIYVNPPWPHFGSEDRSTPVGIKPLKITDIIALPVDELAGDPAFAIIRTPGPRLGDAVNCLKAWDFVVGDVIVGIKDKPRGSSFTQQQHEMLVIGIRENTPVAEINVVPSLYSCKQITPGTTPDEAWEVIETMAAKLKKIMLFPEDRKGWDTWKA